MRSKTRAAGKVRASYGKRGGMKCKTRAAKMKRGIVLTLDIAISMMVLLVAIATAYSYYGSPSRVDFESQLMRGYLQDAATVMVNLDYLSAPILSENGTTNTTGIREVMRATPSSMCMQVAGYGTVVGGDLGGYWKFDEDSGVVVSDSSGNGHTGVIYNGGSLSGTGKSGHALSSDGSNDYADTGYDVSWDHNTPVSISFWLNPSTISATNAGILGKEYPEWEWAIYQDNAAVNFAYLKTDGSHDNGMDSGWGNVLNASRWTYLAYVWNNTASSLYANGVLVNTTAAASPATNKDRSNSVMVGGHVDVNGADKYFNGSIDDLRVYNRALTADEVKLLYSNPSNILYVVDKPECAFSGGEVQSLTVPFAINTDQEENNYYYATFKSWLSGATK